jgi:hypothetical protein
MATATGIQLAQGIRQKLTELKKACAGLDEATASRAPEGRWSPRQILSHLCGPEGEGLMPLFQAILDQDAPTIDIDPENPFFSEKRAKMSVPDLLAKIGERGASLAAFAEKLTPAQLARTAHFPMMADSPWGDHPTLGDMIDLLGVGHVQFHADHMREVRKELATQ